MPIESIDVKGYRSVRDLFLQLRPLNVLVGPNGCGKSNLYNAMFLLHAAASGQFAQSIADEGGMPSVLWAGGDYEEKISYRDKGPVRMTLAITIDSVNYELIVGLAGPGDAIGPFQLDPRIKEENVYYLNGKTRSQLLDRGPTSVWLRDAEGQRQSYTMALSPTESVLSQLKEPHRFPQLSTLREHFLSWRFYHHFRTDVESKIREERVGVFTPVISHDGRDLAAALLTIRHIGDATLLRQSVAKGLAGASIEIDGGDGRFVVYLRTPGIYRPLHARELSDGTLRYLCLLAALLSPRPPSFLALNEPETSLHPDLLKPLAELIAKASTRSQIWITTHSTALADYIEQYSGIPSIRLEKVNGATTLIGEPFGDFVEMYGAPKPKSAKKRG